MKSRPLPPAGALAVETLGPAAYESPLADYAELFVDPGDRVLISARADDLGHGAAPAFEAAGPRQRIYFEPRRLTCGIVTCGGLCPGLNNVIRSLVLRLWYGYGVRRIIGFRYGYAGLVPANGHEPLALTPDVVEPLHREGGTRLGTSRGPQDVGAMVDRLAALEIGVLFVLGGDGGLRGAAAIAAEVRRRGLSIAIVGVPKTIDNDLDWTSRSFGFATAVEAATTVLQSAHTEARATWNGIGLVKLMGRHSGFIAAHAALSNADVNFCLVPEVPWTLGGAGGFLDVLARRLDAKRHAVIVVAEGAGQELFGARGAAARDVSGNIKLRDIGTFLRDHITEYFAERRTPVAIRYIDPSYIIRSLPANALDAQYSLVLGQHAAHAGISGRTNVLVGLWNGHFVHVPIPLAVAARKQVDPAGAEWHSVLEATGQPASMVGR